MDVQLKRSIKLGIRVGLSLGAIVGLVGCNAEQDDVGMDDAAGLSSINGLTAFNGLSAINGLSSLNGLTAMNGQMGTNGLSSLNGLSSMNGLSSLNGLMTTDAGRRTVAYMVRCALPNGDSLVKQDQRGVSYTFPGGIGICPQWKNGPADGPCQERVSACMMAHVNTAGIHIPLWLDSSHPSIGWGIDKVNFPANEGTFFGNIIGTGNLAYASKPGVNGPVAYFCDGAGFAGGAAGVVAGRLGAGQSGVPYVNPFGNGVLCKNTNAVPQYTYGVGGQTDPDGYKAIYTSNGAWNDAVTVWRNPNYTPKFDANYAYRLSPLSAGGKSVDVANASQTDGTAVQQYASWDGDPQKFKLLASGSNWKITMKANNNKCLNVAGGGTANGTPVEIRTCDGSTNQAWAVTPDAATGAFKFKHVKSGRCLDVPGGTGADGARMQIYDCLNNNPQKFKVQAY